MVYLCYAVYSKHLAVMRSNSTGVYSKHYQLKSQ